MSWFSITVKFFFLFYRELIFFLLIVLSLWITVILIFLLLVYFCFLPEWKYFPVMSIKIGNFRAPFSSLTEICILSSIFNRRQLSERKNHIYSSKKFINRSLFIKVNRVTIFLCCRLFLKLLFLNEMNTFAYLST